jgi:predicted amidohydrolase
MSGVWILADGASGVPKTKPPKTVRIAAAQHATGESVDDNLATVLRILDRAAEIAPDLVVLPEFVNHLSWYQDQAHCQRVSVDLDGPFLRAIGDKAREHGFHVVVNCTVRRGEVCTGTSVLFGRDGAILSTSDKQVLMGHENDFLRPADAPAPIVETILGELPARIGTYACMDGVIAETPRGLALSGAQILCNSLNSFAPDEGSLHVPVRAPENRVFVVAANKVGPLIPEALLEPVAQQTGIPIRFLHGAGDSQIVAPDGEVLAKAPSSGEAIVWADIDPARADDKRRPDGTDVFAVRRPELYAPIGQRPREISNATVAPAIVAAIFEPNGERLEVLAEIAAAIGDAHAADLFVLPELCFLDDATRKDPRAAEVASSEAVEQIVAACALTRRLHGRAPHVALTVVRDGAHQAVLVTDGGTLHAQPQLHASARTPWSRLGERLETVDLPFGRVALLTGADAILPETTRLAAIQGAQIVVVSFDALERWEIETGLVERAAENRVVLVAATKSKTFGGGLLADLHEDFTLMTPWKSRPFDGKITEPILVRATGPGLTAATLHPVHAGNKFVSHRTHVVDGRPWRLAGAITAATRTGTEARRA